MADHHSPTIAELEALDGTECGCCGGTVTFDGYCGDCGCPAEGLYLCDPHTGGCGNLHRGEGQLTRGTCG